MSAGEQAAAALKRKVSQATDQQRVVARQPSWNQSIRPAEEQPENQALLHVGASPDSPFRAAGGGLLSRLDASTDPPAKAGAGAMLRQLPLEQTAGTQVLSVRTCRNASFAACLRPYLPPVCWLWVSSRLAHVARFGLDLKSLLSTMQWEGKKTSMRAFEATQEDEESDQAGAAPGKKAPMRAFEPTQEEEDSDQVSAAPPWSRVEGKS
jgi:hypothetical protein